MDAVLRLLAGVTDDVAAYRMERQIIASEIAEMEWLVNALDGLRKGE